ncbi:MAG: prepilin-type N-terminal cleavage/methylation domain-containing protein [Sedimentisphaerales bacterium]|nr:prepilin-type N-terminal cleavage/methylation domain-containing protein [Sedimentisphaerales bacterium]
MTPTCTAQMRFKNSEQSQTKTAAFTLIEAMVAMVIVALLVGLSVMNLAGPIHQSTFNASAQRLTSILQRAANSAYRNGKRYEVIIDLIEQQYVLREISSGNLAEVLEEEIIDITEMPQYCYISYIEFDDPQEDIAQVDEETETLQAKFRAGPAGWQYGGKIVLLDRNDNPYTIEISTLSRVVKLKRGDIPILTSKRKEKVPF